MDAYGRGLEKEGVTSYAALTETGGDRAVLAGVVLAKQERNSARGRYAFVQMSDQTGLFEVTIFAETFAQARDLLEPGEMLLVRAQVQRDDEVLRLTATGIKALDARMARHCVGFRVFVGSDVTVPALKSVVDRERTGRGELRVVVPFNGAGEVEMVLDGGYAVSPAARAALKAVPGVIDVHDL